MTRHDDFMLTAEEMSFRSRKRRRFTIIAVIVAIALLTAFFAARPTSRAIKGWQARRHATKAFAYIEKERWNEARDSARAAFQLGPSEPQALRAVARLLSRTRQQQAFEFWDLLAKQGPLTRDDLRDEASLALVVADIARAERATAELLKNSPAPLDQLLAAQLALQKSEVAEAQKHLDPVLASAVASEQEQLEAAVLQMRVTSATPNEESRQSTAWERIVKLSAASGATGLQALVLRAQRELSQRARTAAMPFASPVEAVEPAANPSANAGDTPGATKVDIGALAKGLDSHPLAKASHKLLALDLLAQADPSQREALIDRAIGTWRDADPISLAALAGWLNSKGAHQRQLDNIPLEKAIHSRDVFLQHVDALGALGRWGDIKHLLEAERFPLDPMMQRMYLARCNTQLGEKTAAENNWQRALEEAAADTHKLIVVADYAQKNGAAQIAGTAYERAAANAPSLRIAQLGRLQAAGVARDTKRMNSVLAEMLQVWPDDPALQNDADYVRLLTSDIASDPEITAIEERAQRRVSRDPENLLHRTVLALARLKQNRPFTALEAYEGIRVPAGVAPPSALVVHAAVFAATGNSEVAKNDLQRLSINALLPEELALLPNIDAP